MICISNLSNEKDVKEAMREVKMALLEADVSFPVVKDFVAKVSERAVGSEVMNSLTPAQQVIDIVHDELIQLMGTDTARIDFPSKVKQRIPQSLQSILKSRTEDRF